MLYGIEKHILHRCFYILISFLRHGFFSHIFYTPRHMKYVGGYIVFAFPFVYSFVRMYVRSLVRLSVTLLATMVKKCFCVKVYKTLHY